MIWTYLEKAKRQTAVRWWPSYSSTNPNCDIRRESCQKAICKYTIYIFWSLTENFIKFREGLILHVMRKQFDFGWIKHPMGEVIRVTIFCKFIRINLNICHVIESCDVIQSIPNLVGDFWWMRQRSIQNLVRIWLLVVDL